MPKTILATMLAALAGLALGACAQQPADDQDESQPLVEDDEPYMDAGLPDPDPTPQPDAAPPVSCSDQGDFDLEEFMAEIFPVLNGEIDLNDPENDQVLTGCTRGPCHGQLRPGSLTLDASRPPEEILGSFACFVDLQRPRRSQVLLCPSEDDGRCRTRPHPGAEIFNPPGDKNYSRILRYIRQSRP